MHFNNDTQITPSIFTSPLLCQNHDTSPVINYNTIKLWCNLNQHARTLITRRSIILGSRMLEFLMNCSLSLFRPSLIDMSSKYVSTVLGI